MPVAPHENPRIILAADHSMLRDGLVSIRTVTGLDVVDQAVHGREAVRLAETLVPDVAVLDISMPVLNGIDAARQIIKVSPKTKILILTLYTEDRYVLASLRPGVAG